MTDASQLPKGGASIQRGLAAHLPAASLVLSVALGTLAGIGGYTFSYAKGWSYFSTEPAACANCHIMQPQYDAWQAASHHTVAVCVDCHLPQAFIPKYLAKAENGWRHGKLFTTGGFKEPIEVQAAGRRILQANCVRCHAELTAAIHGPAASGARATDDFLCTHCHASVGHGVRAGLGGPLSDAERKGLPALAPKPSAKNPSPKGVATNPVPAVHP